MDTVRDIVIVTPVYGDWDAFARLSHEVVAAVSDAGHTCQILAVNDDSPTEPDRTAFAAGVRVLNLTCNLGHQRAIAVGLSWAVEHLTFDAIVVMDADGEDKPSDIPALIEASLAQPDNIVVARRDRRSEGRTFRLGYRVYQVLFWLFTGRWMAFGNFCLLPARVAKRLVFQESLWNHLAATVLRSRFPITMISTGRGQRYAGQSQMNLGSLVLLGFSAISVYSDIALLRTLMVSLLFGAIASAGIGFVVYQKYFTDAAILGWASDVVGSMSIIVVQCLVFSVFLLFVVLSNRSQRGFVAARHYHDYVLNIE